MIVLLLLLFLSSLSFSESFRVWDLTIRVDPKRDLCLHHEWNQNRNISFTYFVKHGGKGDLDINFVVFDSKNRLMINDLKHRGRTVVLSTIIGGEYKFCFDNSHSTVNSKTVYFEFFDLNGDDEDELPSFQFQMEDKIDGAVEDFKNVLNKVEHSLVNIRVSQMRTRMTETWDNYIIERKSATVDKFSTVQLIVMIFAGVVQVLLIRSLFDEKSRIRKIWRTK